jgi:hypothetical protein
VRENYIVNMRKEFREGRGQSSDREVLLIIMSF